MNKSPSKKSVEPLILAMDFLRNPIFLPTNIADENFNGEFLVNGELRVKLIGPPLYAKECDLFHGFTHLAKTQNFEKERVSFIVSELFELIGWNTAGYSYQTFKKCTRKLQQSLIEFESIFEDGWRSWNILTGSSVNAKKSARELSWVRFSPEMLQLFRDGALKAVHPDYFKLSTSLEKRLFGLLSVRASDLECWKIDIWELRDLIPLQGQSYVNAWKVWQTLSRCLEGLMKAGIITNFSKEKLSKSKTQIWIWPNPEFFFSGKRPKTLSAEAPKDDREEASRLEDIDVKSLVSRGIAPIDAIEIIFKIQNGRERARKQIEHLDLLMAQGKPPKLNSAGWLRTAILKDYDVPEALQDSAKQTNLSKAWFLIEDAKMLSRRMDRKSLEKAIEKAREAANLGRERLAKEVIEEAENCLRSL